jgi:hypothetical protein
MGTTAGACAAKRYINGQGISKSKSGTGSQAGQVGANSRWGEPVGGGRWNVRVPAQSVHKTRTPRFPARALRHRHFCFFIASSSLRRGIVHHLPANPRARPSMNQRRARRARTRSRAALILGLVQNPHAAVLDRREDLRAREGSTRRCWRAWRRRRGACRCRRETWP